MRTCFPIVADARRKVYNAFIMKTVQFGLRCRRRFILAAIPNERLPSVASSETSEEPRLSPPVAGDSPQRVGSGGRDCHSRLGSKAPEQAGRQQASGLARLSRFCFRKPRRYQSALLKKL